MMSNICIDIIIIVSLISYNIVFFVPSQMT